MANETADTGGQACGWGGTNACLQGSHGQHAGFQPRPEQLFQEKRVAFALFPEPLAEKVIRRNTQQVRDQLGYACLIEWLKRKCHQLPIPGEVQDAALQCRSASQFIRAVSTQDAEAGDRLMLSHVAEQVERGRIGPVQVIQEQEQRAGNSDGGQKEAHCFIEA